MIEVEEEEEEAEEGRWPCAAAWAALGWLVAQPPPSHHFLALLRPW